MTLIIFKYIAIVLVSYFCANFTFARIVSSTRKKDVLAQGSGNPGTMNMVRNYGFIAGAMTLICDTLKCVIPCLVGYFIMGPEEHPELAKTAIYVAGLACVVGHIYPMVYSFKGGKGVACAFGFALVANWWLGLSSFGVFIIVFVITRIAAISTLSTCIAFMATNTVFLLIDKLYVAAILQGVMLVLLLFAHRSNIKRIFANKEKQIDLKATAEKDKEYIKSRSRKTPEKKVVDENPPEIKEVGDKINKKNSTK